MELEAGIMTIIVVVFSDEETWRARLQMPGGDVQAANKINVKIMSYIVRGE